MTNDNNSNTTLISINPMMDVKQINNTQNSNTTLVSINPRKYFYVQLQKKFKYNSCFY